MAVDLLRFVRNVDCVTTLDNAQLVHRMIALFHDMAMGQVMMPLDSEQEEHFLASRKQAIHFAAVVRLQVIPAAVPQLRGARLRDTGWQAYSPFG